MMTMQYCIRTAPVDVYPKLFSLMSVYSKSIRTAPVDVYQAY